MTRWKKVAEKLAERIPRGQLNPAVMRWVEGSPPRRRWGVAFSGGADSLSLLLLLWAHWPERRARLHALHYNHRLRGEDSNADVRFCRTVCRSLGVKLTVGTWTDRPERISEDEARNARMRFLDHHEKIVWFGHQLDDVAETMLMRLARGSGSAGLSAPRPVQMLSSDRIRLRPLIGIAKSRLESTLSEIGAVWRADASNASDAFLRNRVRHKVIPAWTEAAAPRDLLAGVARSRSLIEEDDAALEKWLEDLDVIRSDGALNLQRLRRAPVAIRRRALHRWLLRHELRQLSSQAVEILVDEISRGRLTRQSVGTMSFAVFGRRWMQLQTKAERK